MHDAAGDFFLGTGAGTIRKVDTAGILSTAYGNGQYGDSGDGGPATAAAIAPGRMAIDAAGNLFLADESAVRRIDHVTGIITTVAGGGSSGLGDGGPATAAQLSGTGMAFDGAGDLFIIDHWNNRVRKVVPGPDGLIHGGSSEIITTVAGNGTAGFGGDGGPATAAQLNFVGGGGDVATDSSGDVFISDGGNNRIRKIDTDGIITTVAGSGPTGSVQNNFGGDAGPATAALLNGPEGMAVDGSGNLFIADSGNYRLRKVDTSGIIATVAGNGSQAYTFDGSSVISGGLSPRFVTFDGSGRILVEDVALRQPGGAVRRIDSGGIITTVAGNGVGDGDPATAVFVSASGITFGGGSTYFTDGQAVVRVDSSGIIHTVAGNSFEDPYGVSNGDGGPATRAILVTPKALAVDGAGNLLIADCAGRVRRVDSAGFITTVAGGGSPADGVGDGGPATSAALGCPTGLFSVNSGPAAGSFYIADCSANRVRKVDPAGNITTVAGNGTAGFEGDNKAATGAELDCASDVARDSAGNLYIADKNNNRVRKVDTAGIITTVAGDGAHTYGPDGVAATASHMLHPTGVLVDPAGNLLITDSGFGRIRKVDTAGIITTVAGTGVPATGGDGGPATLAQLDGPNQTALDPAGNLYIADGVVRKVQAGAYPFPTSGCGQVVTHSVTLSADLGPCPYDGIDVGADNITVNLNGHRVYSNTAGATNGGSAGIRVADHRGVTVTGGSGSPGQVSGFADGVALIAGSGNTVTNLAVHDNVSPPDVSSEFGDGVGMFYSAGNHITNNVLTGNGIYDGIAVVGVGADNNVLQANTVNANVAAGTCGNANNEVGIGIDFNAFLSADLLRQQTITGNQVLSNTVDNNQANGITTVGSLHMVIQGNTVLNNGTVPNNGQFAGCPGNGIGVSPLGHAGLQTYALVDANQVHGNAKNGIVIRGLNNVISNNNAANNDTKPAYAGAGFDLNDASPGPGKGNGGCTTNTWTGNTWGSGGYSDICTTTKGTGP